jgi:hypothetical protein
MTAFPGAPHPLGPEDLIPKRPELDLFARIEGLVGEEAALLALPERDRTQAQIDRVRDIGQELDRIWERLRERAERLGRVSKRPISQ